MSLTVKLTGQKRVRIQKRLFRQPLLVVQVEVHEKGYKFDYDGDSYNVDYKYWRDAQVTDVNLV